jgi:hypothetical protein
MIFISQGTDTGHLARGEFRFCLQPNILQKKKSELMMTQTKAVHLSDLHFEHKLWLNELNFGADELKIYEHYLEDLVKRHSERDMLQQLEHFQNQFIKEKEVIDTLLHDIRESEHKIAAFAKKHPTSFDDYNLEDHSELRDRMIMFRNIFGELKKKFFEFMSEWK